MPARTQHERADNSEITDGAGTVTRRRRVPPLAGAAEFAELANVSGSSVITNWRSRFEDFPEPVEDLAMGPVYLRSDCAAFLRRHPELVGGARRIPDDVRLAIRRDIAAGIARGAANVMGVSRVYGVSRSTVYLMCDDLLFGSSAG